MLLHIEGIISLLIAAPHQDMTNTLSQPDLLIHLWQNVIVSLRMEMGHVSILTWTHRDYNFFLVSVV